MVGVIWKVIRTACVAGFVTAKKELNMKVAQSETETDNIAVA